MTAIQQQEKKRMRTIHNSSNVGVGSGIAVGVGNYTTTADLGSDVTITGTTNQEIGSVTIKATSEGEVR